MIRAFYSGRSGLRARETQMDILSNNVANVNTTGFKAESSEFSDVLYSSMLRPDSPVYADNLVGNGVALSQAGSDMSDGGSVNTGAALDYRPNGSGFFVLEDASGNRFYTQDGSFRVQSGQNGDTLVNAQGLSVLDAADGRISVADGTPQKEPGVVTFSNSAGLLEAGNNLFLRSALSGAPANSNEGVRQGFLEGSNVDLTKEMTQMIAAQRGYQFSSQAVKTADQIESMVNELK